MACFTRSVATRRSTTPRLDHRPAGPGRILSAVTSGDERVRVLISAAGRRGALLRLFRDALAALGVAGEVLAADMTPLAAAFQLADRAFTVPAARDEAFVPTLLELCERERVTLVVPTNDHELPVYAAAREAFAAVGTTVAISAPDV